jgi:hypothetical protein
MSGLKEIDLATFLRLIRARLGGAGVLADLAGVGRCHLSSMLHGDPSRGAFTWAKVRRQVTAVEWSFLEKCSAWNSFAEGNPALAATVRAVPTTDSRTAPLMPVLCGPCGRAVKLLRCEPGQGGKVSHTICPACFTRQLSGLIPAAEIATRLADSARADAEDPRFIPLGAAVEAASEPQLALSHEPSNR